MAENTTKPLEYLCEKSSAFDAVIEMAAAIQREEWSQLAEKPYFTQIITPLPLYFAKTHSDQIIRGAECGIPVTMGTISIGGGSAPYTIAGCMTHSLATDFAGMVLSQLVRKGSFCMPAPPRIPSWNPPREAWGTRSRTCWPTWPCARSGATMDCPRSPEVAEVLLPDASTQDAVMQIAIGLMEAFYMQPGTLDYVGEPR